MVMLIKSSILVGNVSFYLQHIRHMMAELRCSKQARNKQARTSPLFTAGNATEMQSPAPLNELGSRAQAVCGGKPDNILTVSLNLPHKLNLLPHQRGDIPCRSFSRPGSSRPTISTAIRSTMRPAHTASSACDKPTCHKGAF